MFSAITNIIFAYPQPVRLVPYHRLGTTNLNHESQSRSYIKTDGQSASLSWCQAPKWNLQPIVLLFLKLFLYSHEFVDVGHPL
jgi:hypothetical protein